MSSRRGTLTAFNDRDAGVARQFDEVKLAVEPAHDFEAWHATGPPPDKQMIVCMPGGDWRSGADRPSSRVPQQRYSACSGTRLVLRQAQGPMPPTFSTAYRTTNPGLRGAG